MSLAKQNFSNVVEDALNQQISLEMTASQTYLAIAAYMGSDTVALPGLEKFFNEQSEEVIIHSQRLDCGDNLLSITDGLALGYCAHLNDNRFFSLHIIAFEQEREHAQHLIDYQNKRGGHAVIPSVPAPTSEWASAKNAVGISSLPEFSCCISLPRLSIIAIFQPCKLESNRREAFVISHL